MANLEYGAKIKELHEVAERLGYTLDPVRSIGNLTIHTFLARYNPAFNAIKDLPEDSYIQSPLPNPYSDITMVLDGFRVVATKRENPSQSARGRKYPGEVYVMMVNPVEGDVYALDMVKTTSPNLYHTEGPFVHGWGDFSVRRGIILSPRNNLITQEIVTNPANFFGMLLTESPEGFTLDDISIDYRAPLDLKSDKLFLYPNLTVTLPYLRGRDIRDVVIDPRNGVAEMRIGDESIPLKPDKQGNFSTPEGIHILSLYNRGDEVTHCTVMLGEEGLSTVTKIEIQKQIDESELGKLEAIIRADDWFRTPIAPNIVDFRTLEIQKYKEA